MKKNPHRPNFTQIGKCIPITKPTNPIIESNFLKTNQSHISTSHMKVETHIPLFCGLIEVKDDTRATKGI